jgi:hypothetical protein
MKIDKQTLMLFGGGLLAGYLICKFTTKSDATVQFGADGRPRVSRRRTNPFPTSIGSTFLGSTGVLKPHIGATPIGSSSTHSNPISISPINAPIISRRRN